MNQTTLMFAGKISGVYIPGVKFDFFKKYLGVGKAFYFYIVLFYLFKCVMYIYSVYQYLYIIFI